MRSDHRSAAPLFLFTGLLLLGCGATAAPPAPPAPPGANPQKPDAAGNVTLGVSGEAEIAPNFVLSLERVVSDSRCPVDVTCVWAGEIRVAFALDSPQSEAPRLEFELSTTAPKAAVRGLEIELLGALPAPDSRKTITVDDYRISLKVAPAAVSTPTPGASS